MRLINADAFADRLEALAYDDWNQRTSTTWADALEDFAEMVRDEREVKAIPIEWIKQWREDKWFSKKPIEERIIMAMGVRLMLEDWEKENEKD